MGERVPWHVLTVSPDDPLTFHRHGRTWCDRGGVADAAGRCPNGTFPVDNVDLLPAQALSFDVVEDNPGAVVDHVDDGMPAMYEVAS